MILAAKSLELLLSMWNCELLVETKLKHQVLELRAHSELWQDQGWK